MANRPLSLSRSASPAAISVANSGVPSSVPSRAVSATGASAPASAMVKRGVKASPSRLRIGTSPAMTKERASGSAIIAAMSLAFSRRSEWRTRRLREKPIRAERSGKISPDGEAVSSDMLRAMRSIPVRGRAGRAARP